MIDCGGADPTLPVAERLAGYLECHAQGLAQGGFSGPSTGWIGAAFLGAALTLYVALIGYRLVLGLPFAPRDALIAAARAGAVIALATSWPAYDALVYRVTFDGPDEVARALLPGDLPVAGAVDAAQRLDRDVKSLTESAALVGGGAKPAASATADEATRPDPAVAAGAVVTNMTVGALGAIRLAGGLLLGLGPLFIVVALFDASLGLFEGWTRALVTVFTAGVGSMIVASLELDFIESQLVLGAPMTQDLQQSLGPALTTVAVLFGMAMAAVLALSFVVGNAFRLRRMPPTERKTAPAVVRSTVVPTSIRQGPEPALRAERLADAARRLTRRDEALLVRRSNSPSREDQPSAARQSNSPNVVRMGPGRRPSPAQSSTLQVQEPR